jgi:hypothetical protein
MHGLGRVDGLVESRALGIYHIFHYSKNMARIAPAAAGTPNSQPSHLRPLHDTSARIAPAEPAWKPLQACGGPWSVRAGGSRGPAGLRTRNRAAALGCGTAGRLRKVCVRVDPCRSESIQVYPSLPESAPQRGRRAILRGASESDSDCAEPHPGTREAPSLGHWHCLGPGPPRLPHHGESPAGTSPVSTTDGRGARPRRWCRGGRLGRRSRAASRARAGLLRTRLGLAAGRGGRVAGGSRGRAGPASSGRQASPASARCRAWRVRSGRGRLGPCSDSDSDARAPVARGADRVGTYSDGLTRIDTRPGRTRTRTAGAGGPQSQHARAHRTAPSRTRVVAPLR